MASDAYVGRNIDESVLEQVREKVREKGAEFVYDPEGISYDGHKSVHCARVAQNVFYFVFEGPTEDDVRGLLCLFDGVKLQHQDEFPLPPRSRY